MKRSATGYGLDYEHKISKAVAEKLLEACGFPGKLSGGNEVCLCSTKTPGTDLRERLMLQNLGSEFYLACVSRQKDSWKDAFRIDLDHPSSWTPEIAHTFGGGEVAVFLEHNSTFDLYEDDSLGEYLGNADTVSECKRLMSQKTLLEQAEAEEEDEPDFQP